MKKLFALIFISITSLSFGQFLHRDGQNIVNGNGQNVILRGLGLGGWMVQEGYMLQTDAFAGSQHKIKQKITDLIGATNTEEFYQAYRANGITRRDIDSLAAWGFNSIRLPMHYNLYTLPIEQEPVAGQNTWLDEGFTMTDNLLQWCAANNMYLILDMHAAPGGQGHDANISDYDDTKPSLWESQANRDKMVALWQKLALRYKDNPWIGAYDIINEPNWNFEGSNPNGCSENNNIPLKNLMVAITQAIRQVDTNHLIFIEGNCWGNNYNGILSSGLWDSNMALSFHKYWSYNTQASIQGMLNYRTQLNVPIWLGESGENSNVWFKDAIALMEANNIGWAWWPMKKIDNIAGPASVTKTPEYSVLLNYWQNGGTAPTVTYAKNALMQMAENYKMQNVTLRRDVIDAMFRQVQTTATKKYRNHPIPGKVFATEFDMGHNGVAYFDKDVANYRTDTGTFTAWNQGWSMRNDAVDIQPCTDSPTNGYQIGFTEADEWVLYTLDAPADTAYDIDIRYASVASGKIYLEDAAGRISETITLTGTGSYTNWNTVTLADVILKAGANKVKVYFEAGNFNLNYLEFKNPRSPSTIAMKAISAATTILGDKINVVFNKSLVSGIDFSQSNFQLKVNGNNVSLTSISLEPGSTNAIGMKPAAAVNASDAITLSYNGVNILATDGSVQATFTNKTVKNNVGNIIGISGKIEAENFFSNSGLTIETTTDTGGGSDMGYTDSGDYLEYLVNIGEAGNYKIEYRTSGESATGKIKLQLINGTTTDIQTVSLPPTGGWQTWNTVNSQAALPAGRYFARFTVVDPGFNFNWVNLTLIPADDDNDNVSNSNDNCPGTPAGDVVDFNGCTIFSLPFDNFMIRSTAETCRSANNGSIDITSAANQAFLATLSGPVNSTMNFTSATAFENLASGTYTLCITIPSIPTFKRCYAVAVQEPTDLAVLSRPSADRYQETLDLSGGTSYRINLNGTVHTTNQGTITLELKPGRNTLEVKTDRDCQGVYRKEWLVDDSLLVYPNPAKDGTLYFSVPPQQNTEVSLHVYSMIGKCVIDSTFPSGDTQYAANISALAAGTYMIKVISGNSIYNSKFIRQ
ncbi:glycosyl hydrolase [Flavobacterium magnum]|uniref:Glycosyl hydrolase n=1 Tax=Flavobacterium magnum TaxID=2162713 RepID=A0A2S0REH6_9FLAO|nr:carbohydrate-binding protein [Flavobacterium magnum]AWA29700.1 glycosyl hydrolase [Flavobacterium magnum]